MAANCNDFGSESSRSSPAMSESDNSTGELSRQPKSAASPQAGWAEPAVANQQPTCEAGMWSPQNPNGTPLQGWDSDNGDLFAFAHFNSMCEGCEQVVQCSLTLEHSSCASPAFASARNRGRIGDTAEGLICCNRPARERCFALEVLAALVQEEDWTLSGIPGRQAEYLDCLRFYLNQQFLKLLREEKRQLKKRRGLFRLGTSVQDSDFLPYSFSLVTIVASQVEQGKVLQCFDERGNAVWICFCTGLLSPKEESIFCVLQRSFAHPFEIATSWQYSCFITSRELLETKQPWNTVEPILTPPDKAVFFDNHLDLLYAPSSQGEIIQLDSQIWDGMESHLAYFPKFLVEIGVTSQAQKQAVRSALQRAVQLLQYNPFIAVPQFHGLSSKKAGALQLLLPMKLDPDADTTHLALVLEVSKSRRGGRMYRATGLVSPSQAYANARVLMPVHQRWLSSCVFTCDLTRTSKQQLERRHSRTATDTFPNLVLEPKARTTLSAPASFNVDESFSRTSFASMAENWLCISRPSTMPQKGGPSLPPLSFHTTPDSSSPISPPLSAQYGITSAVYTEPSTLSSSVPVSSMVPLSHHQVSSPRNHQSTANMRRTFLDIYGERKSIKGTGVAFPLYADNLLQDSNSASVPRLPSFDEAANGRFEHSCFHGLTLSDKEQHKSENQNVNSFSQGGESTKQTSAYSATREYHHVNTPVADLGGHTWGVSTLGPSLCPSITSEMNGGNAGSASDLSLTFVPSTTVSTDFITQSRQCAMSTANCDMSRLGPMGLFPSQSWSSLDLSAICGDFDGHRQDEYVEFTPADDACPKINISQLPPRFVADYLSGDLPGNEQAAELHTSQAFGRYGVVARSLVRENKNHSGKWFAIVEFSYWTDEAVRLQLIQGGQIRFPDFYGQEDVVFRRHKDKQKKQFCNQTSTLSPSTSCRPFWKYTGTDTRAGKPLFKGPCSKCGKESTVPFKPVVNGQPPRCRNCLPLQQTIPVTMPAELMLGHQSQLLQHHLPFHLNE